MIDTNWKTWGAFFLIAIGVGFELLKSIGGGVTTSKFDPDSLVKGQPYSVRRDARQPRAQLPRMQQAARVAGQTAPNITREQLEKFVAQAGTSAATSFEEGKGAKEKGGEGKDGKKEKSKCDAEGRKLDPKTLQPMVDQNTGGPVMCKKKKKKEEEDKTAQQPEEKKHDDHAKNDSIDSLMNQAIATGQIPQPVPQTDDQTFNTLEDWMRRLLNTPDKTETQKFIDAYQKNLVTAEVFYKITALMIADSRPAMKRLGVLCAGVTQSVLSFQLLASVVKDERQGSEPRQDAEAFLARYADVANLTILERVMRSGGEAHVTVLATKKLDVSANHYLKAKDTSTATPKEQASRAATMKKLAAYFTRFVSLLGDLSTKNSDRDVKEQAGRTLTGLQTLLAAIPTTTPTTGTDGGVNQPTVTPPTTTTGPVAAQSADAF